MVWLLFMIVLRYQSTDLNDMLREIRTTSSQIEGLKLDERSIDANSEEVSLLAAISKWAVFAFTWIEPIITHFHWPQPRHLFTLQTKANGLTI